jgi:CheY-like chemotaxis protein
MEKLLRGLIGEDICLETRLAEGLWSVRADPAQLEQLLMNLAANARDAMPSGGTLTISTENVEGRRPGAMGGTHKVALTITDTGTGLSPEVLAHLFEPFFTTKEKGHGTGLGLSTCFGIARQNNGQITGDNLPGGGARFQVVLPRAEGAAQETGREVAAGSEAKDGWGVVMVVEDEAGVRQLTARVLKDHGYQVLEAPDGQEAMTMARVLRAEVRLLVTDLVMPGMTGAELAERWRGVHPESKVLFMSGYTPEAIQSRLGKVAGAQVLRKPFSRVGLLNAVRAALLG